MSYIFLLEQGEESSAECFSGIPASVLSNGTSTPGNASLPDSGMDACLASQSGTTCKHSMESLGAGASMSFAGAFPARIYPQPEAQTGKAWLESEAAYGLKWQESAGKYDPDTSSWKTHQLSLFGGLESCSETWPKWGMMRSGEWYPLEMLAHDTSVKGCGSLPTIGTPIKTQRCRSENFMSQAKNPFELCPKGFLPNPEWVERLMGWPDGWTDLNGSATDKFLRWQHSHSSSFPLVLANNNSMEKTQNSNSERIEIDSSEGQQKMMTARPYQERACSAIVACRAGIVKAPAGSGKTIIGAMALVRWALPRARLSGRRMRVKVIANTMDQLDQWREALGRFPEIERNCEVELSCYQGAPSLAGVDIALFDECHHIAAPEFSKIARGAMCVRWGFSATPERADELAQDVFRLIGPIVCEINRSELLAGGHLAKARVYMHTVNDSDESVERAASLAESLAAKWMHGINGAVFALYRTPISCLSRNGSVRASVQTLEKLAREHGLSTSAPVISLLTTVKGLPEIKRRASDALREIASEDIRSKARWVAAQEIGIFQNTKRDAKVLALAREHAGDTVLILIAKIEHGTALATQLPGSMVIHSQMRKRDCGMTRKSAIEAFKDGRLNAVFATSLADEGLDVPRANVLILAGAGRSSVKAEQRTARVLRAFHDKKHGIIHDFLDVQHPFLAAQSRARVRLYSQLGYEVIFQKP